MNTPLPCDLERYESSTYSQNGEDGVLGRIFEQIGVVHPYFVEFGAGPDGRERNTRFLEERRGWKGLLLDCSAPEGHSRVRKEWITAETINPLFEKYGVPEQFDLLSIDIDGNDYWVWKALAPRYRPRVVVVEYNASVPPTQSKAMPYDPQYRWRRTDYYGASLLALERLGRKKGYRLVYCERRGVNTFFLRADLCPYAERTTAEIYRPPDYARGKWLGLARLVWPFGIGFRKDPHRRMIDVE